MAFIIESLVILALYLTWVFIPQSSDDVIIGLLVLIAINMSYIATKDNDKDKE